MLILCLIFNQRWSKKCFRFIIKTFLNFKYKSFLYRCFLYKCFSLQKKEILDNFTLFPKLFTFKVTQVRFYDIVKIAYLANTHNTMRTVSFISKKHLYKISRASPILEKFVKFYTQYKQLQSIVLTINRLLHTFFFNLIFKRNTAFLQGVFSDHTILFTTTSTQFGFKKYKRYARFIFEFFLLLSFSYILDFDLHVAAFRIKLLNYFRYNRMLYSFMRGVKSFRFKFFCRHTFWFKRKNLKKAEHLCDHSEFTNIQRGLHYYTRRITQKDIFNLKVCSLFFNPLFEICSFLMLVIIYVNFMCDNDRFVSTKSFKYIVYNMYDLAEFLGLWEVAGNFWIYEQGFDFLSKNLFINFYYCKHFIRLFLYLYKYLTSVDGLRRLQRKVLVRLGFEVEQYIFTFLYFCIYKYIILSFLNLLILLRVGFYSITHSYFIKLYNILAKFLVLVCKYLFVYYKFIVLNYYNICIFNLKYNKSCLKIYPLLPFNFKNATFLLKITSIEFDNARLCPEIGRERLREYFYNNKKIFFNPLYWRKLLKTFKLNNMCGQFVKFCDLASSGVFRYVKYRKSSFFKFLASGDEMTIPYVFIKRMQPFGGCKLPKMRRKKLRLHRRMHLHINSLIGF